MSASRRESAVAGVRSGTASAARPRVELHTARTDIARRRIAPCQLSSPGRGRSRRRRRGPSRREAGTAASKASSTAPGHAPARRPPASPDIDKSRGIHAPRAAPAHVCEPAREPGRPPTRSPPHRAEDGGRPARVSAQRQKRTLSKTWGLVAAWLCLYGSTAGVVDGIYHDLRSRRGCPARHAPSGVSGQCGASYSAGGTAEPAVEAAVAGSR